MIPAQLSPLANHLWQSTLFAALAALLTLALRKNHARMRYWLWLAASVKFLIPFSLLFSLGSQLEWRMAPEVSHPASLLAPLSAMAQISQPFIAPESSLATAPARPAVSLAFPLAAVWFCGFAVVLSTWLARWRRIRRAVREASPMQLEAPIPLMSSPTLIEPGVFGFFRPILLLPEGIAGRLTPAQLHAILAHELCHVRRRDNLAAAAHMLVEAIFWFHPLVWWIGARMVEERERACDEEVLGQGNERQTYAEGILNVCKFYLESPLACASGVTGSDLKKRVEAIMTHRFSHRLTLSRKLLLAIAGMAAVGGPILVGVLNAPPGRAQSKPEALTFEVASIKPANPDAMGIRINFVPGGGLRAENVRLRQLIEFAYQVHPFQISGGPGWMNSQGFDVLAKAPEPAEATDLRKLTDAQRDRLGEQIRQRLQALLAERFQLTIHRETKEMPVYALVVAKNGPKLKESADPERGDQQMRAGRGELSATTMKIQALASHLSRVTGRPVLDNTGLKGTYDFKLEWTPEPGGPGGGPFAGSPGAGRLAEEKAAGIGAPDPTGPSIFTALQEQLGLKLESQKGPVEILVIDRAEKPSEN